MNAISLAKQTVTIAGGRQIAYYDSRSQDGPFRFGRSSCCAASRSRKLMLIGSKFVPIVERKARIIIPDLADMAAALLQRDDVYEMDAFAEDLLHLLDALVSIR